MKTFYKFKWNYSSFIDVSQNITALTYFMVIYLGRILSLFNMQKEIKLASKQGDFHVDNQSEKVVNSCSTHSTDLKSLTCFYTFSVIFFL